MAMPASFSTDDLSRAVSAGVIDQPTAERLTHFFQSAEPVTAEDEQLRLVSGFGDIFVAIGLVLFLGALYALTLDESLVMPSVATAIASWGLAELFTRLRRQALPSILLLFVFAASVFLAVAKLLDTTSHDVAGIGSDAGTIALAGLATCAAVALHWWRFRVPVTVAAACAAASAACLGLLEFLLPGLVTGFGGIVFLPLGLAIFALAMRFDMSDRSRRTRRTDIAFWLHALAAPMVVHPLMQNIIQGQGSGQGSGMTAALLTFVVFALLSLVALTVDRRAMLVSSLIYLGYAIYAMLQAGNALPSTSLVVLLVGAIVLALSLAWRPLRARLLTLLPGVITSRVPPAHAISLSTG